MTEEKFQKKVSATKTFCLGIGIVMFFILIFLLFSGDFINAIKPALAIVFLYLWYNFTKKHNILGPILGIILAVYFIISFNILSIIIGIFILGDCIPMLKYIRENK